MYFCIRTDGFRKELHHDGQTGAWTGRDHTTGKYTQNGCVTKDGLGSWCSAGPSIHNTHNKQLVAAFVTIKRFKVLKMCRIVFKVAIQIEFSIIIIIIIYLSLDMK